ncbi:MAG: hypothetical protein IH950_08080 [Bacteroidetes bacterium]|nr:hypothetical protein [Bacteroidota bacterium]
MKKALYYFILFNSLLLPEILPQQITVTSPNGGENWQAGTEHFITWTDNITENVSIELLGGDVITNGDMELDAHWVNTGAPTTNEQSTTQVHSGTYSRKLVMGNVGWNGMKQINLGFLPNTQYRLSFWVYCVDNINLRYAIWDGNNDAFGTAYSGIDQGAWLYVTKDFITSSDANNTGIVRFITNATVATFYIDDVMIQKITQLRSSTQSDESWTWDIPFDLEGGTDYKVKITSVNDPNIFDLSDNNFTITPNTITITSPNGGENWHSPPTHFITWTANFPGGRVDIQLFKSDILDSDIRINTANDGSYTWTIAETIPPGSDYKVKLSHHDFSSVFDFSDNDFTIVGDEVTVTSPNGGENWFLGATKPITWTDNFTENVKIELEKGGIPIHTPTTSTQSDGLYNWNIPASLPEGSDYKIKITSLGSDDVFDFSDANFTLSFNITVTSPNGGESWQAGTTHQIHWTDNIAGKVKIDLYKGGVVHSSIKETTASDGTYNWDIPFDFPEGSDYKVLITSLDDPTLFDDSDDNFTIFLVPQITVIYPNGGEAWQTGTTETITWTDNFTENVRIRLYSFATNFITVANSVPSSGSYDWDIPLNFPPNDFYKVWINSVNDITIEDDSDAEFSMETTAINITSPNGGEMWQAGTSHQITSTDNFNDDVKIDLYKGGVFHSSIKDTTASDGTYNWNISYNIQGGSDYKVKITSLGNPDVFDFSDNNFTIDANQITVTSPNGGENWQIGSDQVITWDDNFSDNVKIQLFKSDTLYSTIRVSTASDGSWSWNNISDTIPPGSDYKIKISSFVDSSVFDFSDNNFTLFAQEITVTSPNGGENWQIGTTDTIHWNDNISDNVKIQLFKSDTLYSLIRSNTASDGSYTWTIEETIPPGSDYKVKISSIGNDNVFDFSDANFTLSYNITVSSPNGGESWQSGTTQSITWTDNISGLVKIDLYKAGVFNSIITPSTESNGSYGWSIPFEIQEGSDYKVLITSLDDPDIFDFSDNNFTIVGNQVTVTSPNGGENWLLGTTEPITWTDNFTENVKIELEKGGILIHTPTTSTQSDGLYNWNIPASLPEGSDYKIKITMEGNGNVSDYSDANFTLSFNITVTSPNGGESWQAGTTQQIHWTDNIAGKVKIDIYKGGVFHSSIKDTTNSDGTYNWDIPFDFPEGSDYKVLITSLDDPTLFDDSDDNFTIFLVSLITVIYPNGGEEWYTGTTQTITWSDNLTENVRIRLWFFGNFITVENSVPSSGSYDWDIPLNFPPNEFYKVWINSVIDTTIEDYSDGEFSIETTAINITSPNGGEIWQAGSSHQITSTDNFNDDVKIDLYKGGVFDSSIKDTTASDGTYNWNIPYNIQGGSDYKVKITSLGNPDVFDFSDNNFTIVANQLTVTSPNGGESWQIGTDQVITWVDNFSDNVKIQLFKSDTLYSTIRVSTASDSSWSWNNISETIPPGSDYKIKIISLGDSTIFDFSDNNFTLFAQEITVTSPNGGENWLLGTTEPITWADNFSVNVKIELYKGGTFYSLIVNSTSSDGVRNWNIPISLPEGSDYKIKITMLGNNNVFDFSDSVFSLSNEIAVTSPNGNEFWQTGTTQIITWVDNLSVAIKIELYKNGNFYSEISASTPNDGSKPWDIPSNVATGSDYKIKITSIDIADFFDFSDADFTINDITGVEYITNEIPDEYILFQNYPNPFNPSTKIEFGLVEHSSVSLKLYDIIGQEVAVVIDNESLPAGMFRYDFIASNLPSGIYIYYLIVKSNVSDKTFNQPKKMILLK